MAEDSELSLAADGEGKPAIFWKGELLGALTKGRTLLQPAFTPVKAVSGLEGDALRDITSRAEGWIEAQLAKAMGGIVGLLDLAQQADVDGNVRALAVRLADEGGIAGRHYLADAIAALGNHGLSACPSEANFLLVHFDGEVTAEQALEALSDAGYAVRHLPSQGLPNSLRITIGKTEDMTRVIAALRTLCGEAA